MNLIESINAINQDVWGVVLVVFGGLLLIVAVILHTDHLEAIIGAVGSIIGAGAMAFRGSRQ